MEGRKYAVDRSSKSAWLSGPGSFYCGHTLYNILALKDFVCQDGTMVHAGEYGGYVESEANLGQDGNCWIAPSAAVCDDAFICDDALVGSNSRVAGNSVIKGQAIVCDNSVVYGPAIIGDHVRITDRRVIGRPTK